jgi:uncharacterized delta-60 repeat protein
MPSKQLILASCFIFSAQTLFGQPTIDSFNPGANNSVWTMAVQTDGKILVGGDFTTLGGQTRNRIGRLNSDGTLDTVFNPGAGGSVFSLAVQTDGKILVGGSFTTLGGQIRSRIGRLNSNGTLDTNFNMTADGTVYSLALQTDGKIVVAGSFTMLGGQTHGGIGRLNASGTLDTNFNPSANNTVYCLAIQADGKILAGGLFYLLNGQSRNAIGRLDADGGLDMAFNPIGYGEVDSLAIQADGKLLAGEGNSIIQRINENGTRDIRFIVQPSYVLSLIRLVDGRILFAGPTIASGPGYVGRLNADGTWDSAFTTGTEANGRVNCMVMQSDGKILVGGLFTTFGGQSRTNIVRLNMTDAITQNLTFDGSTITWLRGGACQEVWRTTFEASTNSGASWTSLGSGTRISGGWQLTNVSLTSYGILRARGFVAEGYGSWFLETVSTNTLASGPILLANDEAFGFHSNQFGFNLRGLPGTSLTIEASTDFSTWIPIATNMVPTNGVIGIIDPQSENQAQRFYRAVSP